MNLNFRNKMVASIISLTGFLLSIINLSAQTTNFNYATSGLSTTDCNIFDPPLMVQGYTHTSFASHPQFVNLSINVLVFNQPSINVHAATGYAISYPFTANHTYAIGLNVNANIDNSAVQLPYLKIGLSSSLPTKTIVCEGWKPGFNNPPYLSFPSIYNKILSATNNIQIPPFIGSGQPYLLISTYPSNTVSSYVANVYINSISISDVPPITPGSALICSGSSQVFSVNTPYPVAWSSSPSGVLTVTPSGPNNRNGTATVITNINNQVTLIASVTTPNGVVTLNRQVTVGTPVPGLTINGVAPYGAIDATVTTDAPPPYKWYVDGNLAQTTNEKRTVNMLIPAGTCGVNHSLTVRVANACGAATSFDKTYSYSCNGYVVSPNPASSEVTVTAAETMTATKAGTAGITEINISDQMGFLKKKQKFGQVKRAIVSLHGLSTGVYFIEIVSGAQRERRQLSILK